LANKYSPYPGDIIDAKLEPGEYVLNRNAVNAIGKEKLDEINNEEAPRFQEGGFMANLNKVGNSAITAMKYAPAINNMNNARELDRYKNAQRAKVSEMIQNQPSPFKQYGIRRDNTPIDLQAIEEIPMTQEFDVDDFSSMVGIHSTLARSKFGQDMADSDGITPFESGRFNPRTDGKEYGQVYIQPPPSESAFASNQYMEEFAEEDKKAMAENQAKIDMRISQLKLAQDEKAHKENHLTYMPGGEKANAFHKHSKEVGRIGALAELRRGMEQAKVYEANQRRKKMEAMIAEDAKKPKPELRLKRNELMSQAEALKGIGYKGMNKVAVPDASKFGSKKKPKGKLAQKLALLKNKIGQGYKEAKYGWNKVDDAIDSVGNRQAQYMDSGAKKGDYDMRGREDELGFGQMGGSVPSGLQQKPGYFLGGLVAAAAPLLGAGALSGSATAGAASSAASGLGAEGLVADGAGGAIDSGSFMSKAFGNLRAGAQYGKEGLQMANKGLKSEMGSSGKSWGGALGDLLQTASMAQGFSGPKGPEQKALEMKSVGESQVDSPESGQETAPIDQTQTVENSENAQTEASKLVNQPKNDAISQSQVNVEGPPSAEMAQRIADYKSKNWAPDHTIDAQYHSQFQRGGPVTLEGFIQQSWRNM